MKTITEQETEELKSKILNHLKGLPTSTVYFILADVKQMVEKLSYLEFNEKTLNRYLHQETERAFPFIDTLGVLPGLLPK